MIQGNLLFIQCPLWWASGMFSSRKEEEEQGVGHNGKTFPLTIVSSVTQHPHTYPCMSQSQRAKHRYTNATWALGTQPRTASLLSTPSQGLVGVAQTQRLKFKATGHHACCGSLILLLCCCLFWEADKTNLNRSRKSCKYSSGRGI